MRQGSFGAVLQKDGVTLAEVAVYLGDVTNNIAEYTGAVEALMHSQNIKNHSVCFRFDSLLVIKQLQGLWACRAPHLQRFYETCLTILQSLRNRASVPNVRIEHVYREYNSIADGLANEAIDSYDNNGDGRVVDIGWTMFDS